MFIKLFIISVIVVAFVMLSLGLRKLFDKDADFVVPSCGLQEGSFDDNGYCMKCQLKDTADCPEEGNLVQEENTKKNER